MADKAKERKWLDQAIVDLGWNARVAAENIGPPREPPDFDVERDGELLGVEVRRVFRHERASGGSIHAQREGIWERFKQDLADRYYADPQARPISLSAILPSPIDSPSVRPTTMPELIAQAGAIADKALDVLRGLRLDPGEDHEFEVRIERYSPAATFYVRGLPDETEFHGYRRGWQIHNQTTGYVASFDGTDLEAAIAEKAPDRARYASRYAKTALLLVADGERASGYSTLGRGPVASHGFDEIYFLPYRGKTERVARREDPVETKEARETVDFATTSYGHFAWCATRTRIGGECDCDVKQAADTRAALSALLSVVWDVTHVEEPDGPEGTFISREDAARLRAPANRAREAIAEMLQLASEIGHHNPTVEGQELRAAVEVVRAVASPRRPHASTPEGGAGGSV